MDRFETKKYYEKYSVLKGIAYGAIAGVVAGFIMAPFLMASAAAIGLPANSILLVYGLAFGAPQHAMTVGISLHLLASAIIGVVFGSITSIVDRFRITGIGKGIAEGLVTSMIAFAVLFMPISMLVLPPFLAQIIAVGETEVGIQQQGQAMDVIILQEEQVMPALIGLSIADHLIYGAVLGTVMSAFVVRVRKRRGKKVAHVDDNNNIPLGRGEHLKSDQQHIFCPKCQRQFVTEQELEEHHQRFHHSGDAA